jgi:hypothetical protein
MALAVTGLSCTDSEQYLNLSSHPQPDKKKGWQKLIESDLSNTIRKPNNWEMNDGVLYATAEKRPEFKAGGGNIWTQEIYNNFVLDLQFKMGENGNSGIFLHTSSIENWLHNSIEIQLLDSYGKTDIDKNDCGAIYDCLKPKKNVVKNHGEWNRMTIVAIDSRIRIILNNVVIVNVYLNQWTLSHQNPDGIKNKFNKPLCDLKCEGRIGLQYKKSYAVWFKNLWIKKL